MTCSWRLFLKFTNGSAHKVPMIKHDMKDEWENVAKIMVLGYNMAQYFPVALAKPFLSTVFTRKSKGGWTVCYLPGTSSSWREGDWSMVWLIKGTWHNTTCHRRQFEENPTWNCTHKMVLDPAYIADCWSSILKGLNLPPGGLDEVMSRLTPTSSSKATTWNSQQTRMSDSGFP